jgi:hypothetical protein
VLPWGRLCECCKDSHWDQEYDRNANYVDVLKCKKDLDPRCEDGKDCPYYIPVPELVAKKIIERITR